MNCIAPSLWEMAKLNKMVLLGNACTRWERIQSGAKSNTERHYEQCGWVWLPVVPKQLCLRGSLAHTAAGLH